MKRFNKLALIPAAVAATLAGNAYAGTEACFEVYKVVADTGVTAHGTKYSSATCVADASRTGAAVTQLEAFDITKIAYELTGNLDVTLEDVDAGNTQDMHIVYIPTTDIPSGTVITVDLNGATWKGNGNQLHLVQYDGVADEYTTVASSDGSFDGTAQITFLTKAGITIGAGTRLAFTTDNAINGVNLAAGAALIKTPSLNITNAGCPTNAAVSLQASSAVTDGGTGFNITGGVSGADDIIDISAQFALIEDFDNTAYVSGSATMVTAEVDAEQGSNGDPRTLFVDAGVTDFVVAAGDDVLVFPFRMIDRAPSLDQFVTLDGTDKVEMSYSLNGQASAGDNVTIGLFDTWAGAGSELAPTTVINTNNGFNLSNPAGTTDVIYDADDLFLNFSAEGADYTTDLAGLNDNAVYMALINNSDGVMNFNYSVDVSYLLDLASTAELDHCIATKKVFEIDVNGAVLKVPYTYETANNWVRITNEHSEDALISVDIFDESGNEIYGVELGTVGEHASVVYRADWVLKQAKANAYAGTGKRHTMTFTVTAPKNSVHGVSVQAIPGGVDRVMPVLDKNDWRQ